MSFWTDTKVGQFLSDAFSTGSAKLNGTYLRDNPDARSRASNVPSNVSNAFKALAEGAAVGSAKLNGTYLRDYEDARQRRIDSRSSSFIDGLVEDSLDLLVAPNVSGSRNYSGTSHYSGTSNYYGSASGSSSPTGHLVYQDAPYAQAFNMSRETAYQEALANTAHQREVADLKAAGLNPVLSANGGSGASVFGGTVYAPGSSALSVSSSSSSSSPSGKNLGKIFSTVGDIAGALIGISGNPGTGNAVSKLGKALGKAFD